MKCIECSKETDNPKYCSRSCSAKVNNKKPKRKLTNKCKTCNSLIVSNRSYCPLCWAETDRKLSDILYDKPGRTRSGVYSLVRYFAKAIVKDRSQICSKCGYSKHVEICHIKPIADFPLDTLVSVVNSPDNLVLLCPNCHWELDFGKS